MKQLPIISSILFACVLFFFACSGDSADIGAFNVDLATVKTIDNKQAFILDNGKSLFNEEPGSTSTDLKDGQRVWLNYSYISEITPNQEYTIKVNGVSRIAQGELVALKQQTINNLANDPVQLTSTWIGSHYLNISFSIDYYSKIHQITLVTDSTGIKNPVVFIAFRHSKNEDPPGYKRNNFASYDLENLLGKPQGDRTLLVNFNTTNYGDTIFRLIY